MVQINRAYHYPHKIPKKSWFPFNWPVFVMRATADDTTVSGAGARVSRNADGDWIYTTHRDWQSLTEIADELFIDVDKLVEVHAMCASESKKKCVVRSPHDCFQALELCSCLS